MNTLRRSLCLVLLSAVGSLGLADAASASVRAAPSASASTITVQGVRCTKVTEVGIKKTIADRGMSAFTVKQYKGYCRGKKGSAWMRFASVYVWQQYHVRGFKYNVMAGVATPPDLETHGFVYSPSRQRLTYSKPIRTTAGCSQGWGKLYRLGSESPQGLTKKVC